MDAWNKDQLEKMKHGGNGPMNAFFQKYGVAKNTDVRDKYNSVAAEYYREMLKARVEGREYTPPPPSSVNKRVMGSSGGSSNRLKGSAKGDAGWDSWEDDQKVGSKGGQYSLDDLQRSAAGKDDFFARKQRENAMRPEGLPPSQGGKYVGFGSTPAARPASGQGNFSTDDVAGIVSKGFSDLSMYASQAATAARHKASEMNDALQEAGVAEKTKEYGAKGWALLRSAYATAASTIEKTAAQQGYKVDLGSRKVADGLTVGNSGKYNSIETPAPYGHGFEEPPRTASVPSSNYNSSNSLHASRASSISQKKQPDLLDMNDTHGANDDDDEWADWGSTGAAQKPDAPKVTHKQEDSSGWDGWDDEVPPNGARTINSDQQDDSWGTW